MKITIDQLSKDIAKLDLKAIAAPWLWLIKAGKTIFMVSSVGDLFLIYSDNSIHWLDTGRGTIRQIANNLAEFQEQVLKEENLEDWFLASLVEEMIDLGNILKEQEVYSFKELPAFGGLYESENLIISDIYHHFETTGKVQQQLINMPEAGKLNNTGYWEPQKKDPDLWQNPDGVPKSKANVNPSMMYPVLICGILITLIGIYLKLTHQVANGSTLRYKALGKNGMVSGATIIIAGLIVCLYSLYYLSKPDKRAEP